MAPAEAIQILEQFERLDDDQVAEISGLIRTQAERLETQGMVLAARDKIICQQQDQFREATQMIATLQSRLALAIDTMANAEGCVLATKMIHCPADYVSIGCYGRIKRYVEGAGE